MGVALSAFSASCLRGLPKISTIRQRQADAIRVHVGCSIRIKIATEMVVGERDLQALYASVSQKMQMNQQNPSAFAAMASQNQWCPCVEKRQSITRSSSLICTCNPMAPRQITVSPSVSTAQFSYQRSPKFGAAAGQPSSASTGPAAVSPVSAAATHQGMDMEVIGMDIEMVSNDNNANGASAETTMIVDVSAEHGPVPSAPCKHGIDEGMQLSVRPAKRARTDGAPSAVTLLSSQAPMPAEQREELTRLLQHQDAHGEPLSYGDVVQHFAQRGVWLGSDAKTWLLRVLAHGGQN